MEAKMYEFLTDENIYSELNEIHKLEDESGEFSKINSIYTYESVYTIFCC